MNRLQQTLSPFRLDARAAGQFQQLRVYPFKLGRKEVLRGAANNRSKRFVSLS
ncbi:hypothetical protein [Sphingomonas melonis]